MIKHTIPQLDLPRIDYESEIRHLVSIGIKSLVSVRDDKIIQLLKKYQDEMVFSSILKTKNSYPYLIVDVYIGKEAICIFDL